MQGRWPAAQGDLPLGTEENLKKTLGKAKEIRLAGGQVLLYTLLSNFEGQLHFDCMTPAKRPQTAVF